MSARRREVDLIGVRFDGSGRAHGQSDAAPVLRGEGLARVVPGARLAADVPALPPDPARGPSGFANELALLAMVEGVHDRVRASLEADRLPVLYGADCAVLLGAVPALRDAQGDAGLLLLDAHEDATPMERSPDGEAANMEVALLLGSTGAGGPESLSRRLPALGPESVVMVGQRDEHHRAALGAPSLAGRVRLHPATAVHGRAGDVAADAVEHLDRASSGWWLHIDLDVLRGDQFRACAAATDPAMPGGLTWSELSAVAGRALRSPRCRGVGVGVYNTDLDDDRRDARKVVRFLGDLFDR